MDSLEALRSLTNRRYWLNMRVPLCMYCSSGKVHLLEHVFMPATWYCNKCHQRFKYEPDY